ncbi:sigma-70 family RNA polymerase sigma factor [Paraburkholderia sp. UYCP14C]|uniref:sigma-70 family RNA polymerase sigma factor n=1 Tax=Paraburkholderia sp. UYCP14C TaxID=2511130 RepID=UPI0010225180|nr:sigma-70 family RNA polymerase sigma factor [Paraburkholderia sp. UYCP14C]RZF29072.1 sigma-70 family RNA polymerase sigma factor [Paraburkholderia sp. UYCP14C]
MKLPLQDANANEVHGETLASVLEEGLWAALRDEGGPQAREAVFAHFLPYARALAAQLYAGRHHDDVEFKDFLQLACVGLLEAIDRFKSERGVSFRTFCTPRLRGNVLTGVQRLSDAQEQIALRKRIQRERIASLAASAGTGKQSDTFQALATLAAGLAIGFMLDDTGIVEESAPQAAPSATAYQTIAWRQTTEKLHTAVARLPAREQKIIRYHYFHGLGLEQIADIFGVTKGRISQLHRGALLDLRDLLGNTQHLHITG